MKISNIFLRNFLIIKKSDIELSSGLTTVTGETGSGKSLFVSAMKALRGERLAKTLLGKWGKSGEICAGIALESGDDEIRSLLSGNDIEPENGQIVVRRVFGEKNSAYLNDTPVSSAFLASLLGEAIEIGSQFENRELFKKDYRMKIVDLKAENSALLTEYKEIFHKIQSLKKTIEELKAKDDISKRDYLEYQIREIEKTETYENEEAELLSKIKFAENRVKIVKYSSELINSLNSSLDFLNSADSAAADLAGLDEIGNIPSRVSAAAIEIDDIAKTASTLFSKYDEPIDNIEEIQTKFDKLSSLFMKHGVTTSAGLLKKLDSLNEELFEMNKIPRKTEEAEKELAMMLKKGGKLAEELRRKRLEAIKPLEENILKYLLKFGMKGVRFSISLNKLEELNETGFDEVIFGINTVGTEKMSDITSLSGGELSRLLLAVKLIDDEEGKVILFDEIDSSIGGETARGAALEMKKNSRKNQIIVITHFPQTASLANTHIVVRKSVGEGEVETEISILDNPGRVRELARMMGKSDSADFLAAAEKMIAEKV
ncbi:AAA family ATPase [bacterium]|nr:AAA family ATPase [bacterium]